MLTQDRFPKISNQAKSHFSQITATLNQFDAIKKRRSSQIRMNAQFGNVETILCASAEFC